MLKDFIKYRTYLRKQSLSVNEQYMMELLYEYYNADYGYAFPSFQTLMNAFNTTSKNRVSKVIKDLEEKGFITVDRANKNNRYIINDLKSYLAQEQVVEPKKDIQPQEPQQKQPVVELVVDNTKSLDELTEDVVEEIGVHSVELPLDCAIIVLQSVQDIMTQDINKTTIKAVLQSKLSSIAEIVEIIERAKANGKTNKSISNNYVLKVIDDYKNKQNTRVLEVI